MTKQIQLYLDNSCLPPWFSQAVTNHRMVQTIPSNLQVLSLDDASLLHAYELMCDPGFSNYELSHIFASVSHFFRRHTNDPTITIIGSADHKRACSEQLGVALGCHAVNQFLGVEWKTICQIPVPKRGKSKRADYEGNDSAGSKVVFECKGTTHSSKVDGLVRKAREQLLTYPHPAQLGKLSFVSCFPTIHGSGLATMKIADPPVRSPLRLESSDRIRLHAVHLLNFLDEFIAANALRREVIESVIDERGGPSVGFFIPEALQAPSERTARSLLEKDATIEVPRSVLPYTRGRRVYSSRREMQIDGDRYVVTKIVDSSVIDAAISGKSIDPSPFEVGTITDKSLISTFDDGSILVVERVH